MRGGWKGAMNVGLQPQFTTGTLDSSTISHDHFDDLRNAKCTCKTARRILTFPSMDPGWAALGAGRNNNLYPCKALSSKSKTSLMTRV